MKLITISLLLTAIAACATTTSDGDEVTTTLPATAAPTNDARICAAECGWRDRCGGTTLAACTSRCLTRYVDHGATLREGYVANAETCFPNLTCHDIDDVCLERWGVDQGVPEMQACVARNLECSGSFGHSLCYAIPALTDAARVTAAACLSQSCADAKKCVRDSLGVH